MQALFAENADLTSSRQKNTAHVDARYFEVKNYARSRRKRERG